MKGHIIINKALVIGGLLSLNFSAVADIVLIGSDLPRKSVLDGDFDTIKRAGWRQAKQSPFWTSKALKGGYKLGLSDGLISSGGNELATYESPVLNHQSEYQKITEGDVLSWRFTSKSEYPCDGRVSFSLVFGDGEQILINRAEVPAGPKEAKVFEGRYTVSAEDVQNGLPFVRFTMESDHDIKVYVDYVDLKVLREETAGPRALTAKAVDQGVALSWNASQAGAEYGVYRSDYARKEFKKVATAVRGESWTDTGIVNGRTYYYIVTRMGQSESTSSPVVKIRKDDVDSPIAPTEVKASGKDWEVNLSWKTSDEDIESYNLFRSGAEGEQLTQIAKGIKGTTYIDTLPIKDEVNTYAVQAVDYSGNKSPLSKVVSATVKTVRGSSFSDLILPMPIHKELRSDLWGAEGVLPRDADNGMEHPDWSYWGGKVVKDSSDGKYHILIARWPEGDRKGHWAWPESTVAHVVADKPTGPYREKDAVAYDFKNGFGHNPNMIVLNDGTYALYSLINWKACILTSDTMNGPWKYKGEMEVKTDKSDPVSYRFFRNLSGIQCADGSFLFVTKAGAMMRSTKGILGPYEPLTKSMNFNPTLPKEYSNSNYEDPTLWYDGVQYHMLINAFIEYRGIYLRSPDGVHWKYETGVAFTPTSTIYEDGTRNLWYKVERPNVLQDEYGRATHLSLAVLDVLKDIDYGNDKHSSKHIVLPLEVYKRLDMLNEAAVDQNTKQIKILVHSEEGFDAQKDIDLSSLRFGASEEVNYGRGAKLQKTEQHPKGIVLIFDGEGNGITDKNFVGKLIGKSKTGKLIVGYSKLQKKEL